MTRSNGASSAADAGRGRPLALVGATASGKTAVGILLAEALGTEIIGCDSRQLYRELEIGTAKPSRAERARVPHHLVDVVGIGEHFSVAAYRARAEALLGRFAERGIVPLFVGGTGLYLRAALAGLTPAPQASAGLRRWLAGLGATVPGGLHRLLERVDAEAAARLHPNDRYRLLRALEVYFLSGRTFTAQVGARRGPREPLPAALFAIEVPGPELRRRIAARLDAMLASGFVEEARRLLEQGVDAALPALRAVGYPELFAHLRGEIGLDEARERIRRATWQYARRQLTWFRAEPGTVWIPAAAGEPAERIAEAILSRWRDTGRAA